MALQATATAANAQSSGISREYPIKAAFLYNFASYIQWPAEAFTGKEEPFAIGVLGYDPFGSILDEIAARKKVGGRRIVIRRFSSMQEYTPCHLLFIPGTLTPQEQAAAIQQTRETPVLLVGETAAFAERGGGIGFFVEQNRLRFAISTDAADQQQLKISSKLLSLAKLVDQ
ncbi:MAG: YfiR family protein [Planctomycetes bacterium]|nr:YfiR family protein [Planctomycetota bacterium]